MKERIQKLRAAMREKNLDGVLITSGVNIRYISGFTSVDGLVLVTQNDLRLFTDFRYIIQAGEELYEGFELTEITADKLYTALGDALKSGGVETLGFEIQSMTCAVYDEVKPLCREMVPFSEELNRLRLIKTPDEVALLQKAQSIADAAYAELLTRVKPGMSEREVRAELLYICGRLGSDGPSFEPIIGSGPNGAMCHAVPSARRLQSGDLVVVDFGCLAGGYCSDMTRTFGVGRLDDELIRIYDIVRRAQALALDALRAGIGGKALDAVARDYITAAGYGEAFGHGLGHGFGLQIHEAPSTSLRSTDTLEAGMTITIEPGVYLEGKGGVRIEDCCVVTEEGCLNLVSSGKDLTII